MRERISPMIGKLLDRRYQVIQVLGAGGFGRTYLAQDTRRPGNPICVVKQLKPVSSEPSFLETARRLFNSEAETLEQLGNHDQIPRLLAYFEEDQEFYLVQEFIEGHTLTQELQPGQRWEESRVITLLEEVLSALEFVHKHGVIHRDIKPDNLIRRTLDNKLVLVDFGAVKQIRTQLATAYGGQASATIAVGTPGYMASEQAMGQPRPNSDIYALGVIAIQALTGLMPSQFEDDLNTGELLWQHQASVGRGLAMVLTKMVRYHFKDRYQSATEALQALRQLNSPYASTSYPTTPVYPSVNDVPPPRQSSPQPSYSTPPSERRTQAVTPPPPPPPPQPVVSQPSYEPVRRSNNFFPVLLSLVVVVAAGLGLTYALDKNLLTSIADGDRDNDDSEQVCTVATGALNVRAQPQGSVVAQVRRGTSLSLTGDQENGWVEIDSPVRGWVYNQSQYINCAVASERPDETEPQVSPSPVARKPSPSPVTTPSPQKSPDKPKPVDNNSNVLTKASEKYQNGDLQGAIADAQAVLPGSAEFQEAQAKIQQWQEEWNTAQEKFNQIQQALNEGRYIDVLRYAADTNFPEQRYWRERLNKLIEEARKRKAEADAQKEEPSPTESTPPAQTEPVTPSPAPTGAVPGT